MAFSLNFDEALAARMNRKSAEVAGNPTAAQFFGHGCCCSGASKEVGDQIAGLASEGNDPLDEGLRLLRFISETLSRLCLHWWNVHPHILQRHARHLIEITLLRRNRTRPCLHDPA